MKKNANIEKAIVVFDTSILSTENRQFIACSDFENFLIEVKKKSRLKLYIPRVVIREIRRHIIEECEKNLNTIRDSIQNIEKFCCKKYEYDLVLSDLIAAIQTKIDNWIREWNIQIIDTPYDKIQLSDLEDSAIEHRLPFEERGDKGVKDYLILRSVEDIRSTKRNAKIVFLCKDENLSKAFRESSKLRWNSDHYFSFAEYANHINLQYDKFSTQLMQKITKNMGKHFFGSQDKSGYYYDFKIWEKTKDKYDQYVLKYPPGDESNWKQMVSTKLLIGQTKYLGKDKKVYRFSTKYTVTRKIQNKSIMKAYIRTSIFNIKWNAVINKSGKFLKANLEDIDLISSEDSPDNFALNNMLIEILNRIGAPVPAETPQQNLNLLSSLLKSSSSDNQQDNNS